MAHVTVTIKKSKHPTQPYTFTIDKPGPAEKETKKERYMSRSNARRGARRQLGAYKPGPNFTQWYCDIGKKVYIITFL